MNPDNRASVSGSPIAPGVDAAQQTQMLQLLRTAAQGTGGWLSFERYMELALHAPGLGYYSASVQPIGAGGESDFITAPVLSPLFAATLAPVLLEAMRACEVNTLVECGAGTGHLALGVLEALEALGELPERYLIIELSAQLRAQQAQALARFGERVQWLSEWPPSLEAVVVGNEVIDAMPVRLMHFNGEVWLERGVRVPELDGPLAWEDRPAALDAAAGPWPEAPTGHWGEHYTAEWPQQAEAFVRSLGERLQRGAIYLIDYGFPRHELYHPQRSGGTLMAHHRHRSSPEVLHLPGAQDITAHVDFTGLALAGQDVGLDVLGYTSQARFLLNAGLGERLAACEPSARSRALMLVHEHEMGELFKVLALVRGGSQAWRMNPLGFQRGDRTHTL